MKTLYKICAIIAAVFVFGLCLVPFNRTAKAADDNETDYGAEYNFILVTLPIQYSFTGFGSYPPKYVSGPLRFTVYNTKTNNTGSAFTVDYLYTFGNNAGTVSSFLLSSASITPWYWYIPANGATMSGTGYGQGPTLTITKETSETITGTLKTYTTGLYSTSPTKNTGFYVTFNFETGYKKYTFATDNNWSVEAHGQTVPLTTTIATVAADTISSYNEGKNIGYTTGYNEGFDAGKVTGDKTGYNRGYNEGFTAGRNAPEYSFREFFEGFGSAFVTIYTNMLDYEFLGINLMGLIGTIVVIATVAIVVKFLMKK